MPEQRLHGLVLVLCLLAWGLETWQLPWLYSAVVAAGCAGSLVVWRHSLRLGQVAVLVALVFVLLLSPPVVERFVSPEQRPDLPASDVAEALQERFFALEHQLAAWARSVAASPSIQETLRAYGADQIPQPEARRRLFDALPPLSKPAELQDLDQFLGVSIVGPSHELMAWSGSVAESFDADLDRVEPQGMTLYVEELSLSTIKVLVPVTTNGAPVGFVAIDLIVQKPGPGLKGSAFLDLVTLLEPPEGYRVSFTPKTSADASEPSPSSDSSAVSLVEGLSGDSLGYLSVERLASRPRPLAQRLGAMHHFFWNVLIVVLGISSAFTWGAGLISRSRADGLFRSFLLTVCLFVAMFHELGLGPLQVPGRVPSDTLFRLALVMAGFVWWGWVSLRFAEHHTVRRELAILRASTSGILFCALLSAGFPELASYVRGTPMEIWSLAGATEVIPRLLGHLTTVTALFTSVFLLAAALEPCRGTSAGLGLLLGGAVACGLGASLWSALVLGATTLWLSRQLSERVARMRVRLVPATLGSIALAFVLVAAYYPTVERAAFEARQQAARNLALQTLGHVNIRPQHFLAAELDRLLREESLCQDLARKDAEVLGGLAPHYWVESALSKESGDSSITVLSYDGTPVSTFSTAVQDYGQPEQEFLAELLRSRRQTSRSIHLEGRSIDYLGSPVHCGGVLVGSLVLSLETSEFLDFPSDLFEPGEVRVVELSNGRSVDPADPRLLPPVEEGHRQVGERIFRVSVLAAPHQKRFNQLAVLVRIPTNLRRLYAFLWACVGSAVFLVLALLLAAGVMRVVRPPDGPETGLVLRFADKTFLGFVGASIVPILILAPVYRRVLEDRLESTVKDRGAAAAEAAKTMILEKGTDVALNLAERLVGDDSGLSPDLARQLSRDPIVSWTLYSPDAKLKDGDALQPHQLLKISESLLGEVAALGQPIASFEDSQGQSVLQVVLPLFHSARGERTLLGFLAVAERLFSRDTDRILLKVQEIIGQDVELYSPDGYLQASSRWPYLQVTSPSRRIHPEAFYFIGILGAQRHTVIRKQEEQYRTFTTYRPCLDRQGALTGFIAVSVGLSASETLAAELRSMGLLIALVAFAGLLLSTLVATVFVNRIAKPISELMQGTSSVAGGDLDVQLKPSGDDEITHLVGSFNAMVGQLRRQREELAKTHRLAAWAEAARRVAHEIKNPLTPILLSTQHLRQVWEEQSPKFGQFFYRCTDTIIEQVKSLQHIATEFSRFARLPAPKLEPGELNEAVQSAVSVFQGALPERVRLEVNLHAGGTRCEVDQEAVARSVVNLIQNAIHAVEEKGIVRISTEPVEKGARRFVRLTVADDGVGIPEEMKPRLFEPYFSTKLQGTGLGLAIAKRTFDEHHCQIQVRSEPGHGTVFEIDFPALAEDPEG
jgi:signal transduction histidine kinase